MRQHLTGSQYISMKAAAACQSYVFFCDFLVLYFFWGFHFVFFWCFFFLYLFLFLYFFVLDVLFQQHSCKMEALQFQTQFRPAQK